MAKVFSELASSHQDFIQKQQLFFVATAPLMPNGHVNLSPKGLDTFQILSPTRVAYLDLTGSGNETSAHLVDNVRMLLMSCSFERQQLIWRLYGQGRVILPNAWGWTDLATPFRTMLGARQIIMVDIHRVQTSCGYGIPLYDYQGQRPTLSSWAQKKGPTGLAEYQIDKGSTSIDGLVTPIGQTSDSV